MKRSELKKIVREEIQNLNEANVLSKDLSGEVSDDLYNAILDSIYDTRPGSQSIDFVIKRLIQDVAKADLKSQKAGGTYDGWDEDEIKSSEDLIKGKFKVNVKL